MRRPDLRKRCVRRPGAPCGGVHLPRNPRRGRQHDRSKHRAVHSRGPPPRLSPRWARAPVSHVKQADGRGERGRRERAASYTAGVTISLVTTGDEVSFDLSVVTPIHYESASVAETIELARARGDERAAEEGLVDGVDLYVDGAYVMTAPATDGVVTLAFDNPNHAPANVTVYLPCLMSVAVATSPRTAASSGADARLPACAGRLHHAGIRRGDARQFLAGAGLARAWPRPREPGDRRPPL